MKTSNKLLLTAVLFLLASLAAYNMTLKHEFKKGYYKDPFKDYTALRFTDFNELQINPGSLLNVQVTKGPYGVWVRKGAADFVQVKQTGKRLHLDVVFPAQKESFSRAHTIMISCPQLIALTTDAAYVLQGKRLTDKISEKQSNYAVTVSGFMQDSLLLRQDNASTIRLTDNALGQLRAVAGLSPGSSSALHVLSGNRIAAANFDIRNRSQLLLEDVAIAKLRYQFADSAKATISGAALGMLTR